MLVSAFFGALTFGLETAAAYSFGIRERLQQACRAGGAIKQAVVPLKVASLVARWEVRYMSTSEL